MNVVIGLIFDATGKILITRRAQHAPLGGLWEFPGGKQEPFESLEQALHREIKEEVGLEIQACQFECMLKTEDSNKSIYLYVYRIDAYLGQATLCESQLDLRWVSLKELSQFSFPEMNAHIIKRLGPEAQ